MKGSRAINRGLYSEGSRLRLVNKDLLEEMRWAERHGEGEGWRKGALGSWTRLR